VFLIRDISDTAIWAAVYRARENDRRDALFRDPYARLLVGRVGKEIAASLPLGDRASWSWAIRTYLFDQFIRVQVRQQLDMVINLAAGLDARPYRMALPPLLTWIELDLPEIVNYKNRILGDQEPVCRLERFRLDLADIPARRKLFRRLARRTSKAMVITEGLLVYLTRREVAGLANDLATCPGVEHWILDLLSPGLLRFLRRSVGRKLEQAGAPLRFGPGEGPRFFLPYGWEVMGVRSLLGTAARLHRLPLQLQSLAMAVFPGLCLDSRVCVLARQ
jgi:methyltransferase (TIGR00027 family)